MAEIVPTPHHLYVIEFTDRVVKVGRSCHLLERLRVHLKDAREIGETFRAAWHEPGFSLATAKGCERALIAFCKARWPVAQGLEFFDAPFDEVVSYAEELAEINREVWRMRREQATAA
jgi:hypothetical protein